MLGLNRCRPSNLCPLNQCRRSRLQNTRSSDSSINSLREEAERSHQRESAQDAACQFFYDCTLPIRHYGAVGIGLVALVDDALREL
jgi:hypothetical protein